MIFEADESGYIIASLLSSILFLIYRQFNSINCVFNLKHLKIVHTQEIDEYLPQETSFAASLTASGRPSNKFLVRFLPIIHSPIPLVSPTFVHPCDITQSHNSTLFITNSQTPP